MASLVLSFVGQQDPVSDNTREDGSIVSLVRHLQDQAIAFQQIFLLYTHDNEDRAILTQGWLADPPFSIPPEAIALIPVEDNLSNDPVNLLGAVQAARQGLEQALAICKTGDRLELNASSGTPVMKSAWSILQAAGYAPHSRIWQVRNPKTMQPGQERVFQTNVDVLRHEFDIKVAKQQINDYNYSGAIATLTANNLDTPNSLALLRYGHCRLAFDFHHAYDALNQPGLTVRDQWQKDISRLRQKNKPALLVEVYFNAQIKLKNQQYSDFLVNLFGFQEGILRYGVEQSLDISLPESYAQTADFWQQVQRQHPQRYQHLQSYRLPSGHSLDLQGFVNRPTAIALWEQEAYYANILPLVKELNQYYDQRNSYVHRLEGVSDIPDADQILIKMRRILKPFTALPKENPFDRLNADLNHLLTP